MLHTYAPTDYHSDISEEDAEASAFIMKTLGILIIISLIVGVPIGQFGIAISFAFTTWIPAVLIVGGIKDYMESKRQVRNS